MYIIESMKLIRNLLPFLEWRIFQLHYVIFIESVRILMSSMFAICQPLRIFRLMNWNPDKDMPLIENDVMAIGWEI